MTELTDVPGIGPNMAKQMNDEGFETVTDILEATSSELTDVKGVGQSRADDIINAARDFSKNQLEKDEVVATHYNPTTGESEDDMQYYCDCGAGPFENRSTRDAHEMICDD